MTVYYLKEKENFCEAKTQYPLFLFRYLSCVHTGSNVVTRDHKVNDILQLEVMMGEITAA